MIHGIPAISYVDRGPGYRNEAIDADVGGLMERLSTTKNHALPYGSQASGRIERSSGQYPKHVAKRMVTYIGRDHDKEAAQAVHRQTRRELAQFGASQLLPGWADWTCLAYVPLRVLVQAAWRSKARGLLPPNAECLSPWSRPSRWCNFPDGLRA